MTIEQPSRHRIQIWIWSVSEANTNNTQRILSDANSVYSMFFYKHLKMEVLANTRLAVSLWHGVRRCFISENISNIHRLLAHKIAEQLSYAFVTSRLDYCNSLLSVIPPSTICHLQRIQNISSKIQTRARKIIMTTIITPIIGLYLAQSASSKLWWLDSCSYNSHIILLCHETFNFKVRWLNLTWYNVWMKISNKIIVWQKSQHSSIRRASLCWVNIHFLRCRN